MMRIMNTFGALIVRFEIGLLQRRRKKKTYIHKTHACTKTKTKKAQWEHQPKTIYQKSLTDG